MLHSAVSVACAVTVASEAKPASQLQLFARPRRTTFTTLKVFANGWTV
jgi:hypothetical protein